MLSLKKTCSNTRIFISKMLEFEQHIWGLQHPNGPAKVCIMVFVYPNPQFYLWQCVNSICIRYIQYTTMQRNTWLCLSCFPGKSRKAETKIPWFQISISPWKWPFHPVVNLLVSPRSARSPPRKLPIPPPCSRSPVDLSPGWELGITSFYNPYANHGAGIWIQTFTP